MASLACKIFLLIILHHTTQKTQNTLVQVRNSQINFAKKIKIQQLLNKSFEFRLSMSNFTLKEESLGEFRGNGSRSLDACNSFRLCVWCVMLAEAQRNLQLNWPVIRGWDLVSRVVTFKRRRQSARSKPACVHKGTGWLVP